MSNTINVTENKVNVNQSLTNIVKIASIGPQGPAGEQGPSGSQGAPGTSDINTGSLGSTTITGSLTVSGSSTLTNIGPFSQTGNSTFTGDITLSGSLIISGSGTLITSNDTGSFITNSQTGSFLTSGDTGSFITNSQTSSMTVLSSSFATTASFISSTFISSSAAASGFGSGGGGSTIDTGSLGSTTITGSLTVSGSNTFTNIGSFSQTGDSTFTGNITASANISASSTGSFAHIQLPGQGTIQFDNTPGSNDQYITGYDNNISIYADGELFLSADRHRFTGGAITASRSISSSGDIFGVTASFGTYIGDGSGITGIISSSYALTASHALNAGGGSGAGFPFTGDAVITGSLLISASATSQSLSVIGSGSTQFDVIGSVGTLFSVDDSLTGTVFSANDISGFPILQAESTGEVYLGKSPQSLYTTAVVSSTTAATTHSLVSLSTSSYDGAFFEYTAISSSNARAGSIMSVWNGSNIVSTETTSSQIGNTTDLTTKVIISGSTARLVAYGPNASYKVKTIIKAI